MLGSSSVRRRKLVVGHKLARDRAADLRFAHDSEAQHLRIRKQAFEVGGILGVCDREGGAVERCGGGVEDCQLAPGREVGEVDEQVGALGRREQEPVRRHGDRGAEESVVRADLRDPLEFRSAVAQQHEPIRAGVGAVEHAEAVGRRLDVEDRPDLAVDDSERRERFHHFGVGLVNQSAGQPPLLVEVEVAVLNQQRHFERRCFR
jgi:hypothetical protein